MRGLIQDAIRWCIGRGLVVLGFFLEFLHRRRIRRFGVTRARLERRLGVTATTPLSGFDAATRDRIEATAKSRGQEVTFAATSGSTKEPKLVAYTQARVRAVKWAYSDAFARAFARQRFRRHSLYVFSALSSDASLTSLLLHEPRLPPWLSTLQAPYRVHAHPAMQALAAEHGATAVRLFVLAVANPGVLYATNPSTISTFLDRLEDSWPEARGLSASWIEEPGAHDSVLHMIRRRLDSRGAEARLTAIAKSERPLSLLACAPAIEAYVTWDGGDLSPFLRRIEARLDPARVRRIPMYSMSTETIETVSHYHDGRVSFLPLADGVLVELLPEDAPDRPERLIDPRAAELGKRYTLVASDRFGLLRYQTEDLFSVAGFVEGLPDLRFERRRGLTFSFTGEKLTAEHAVEAFQGLRQDFGLPEALFLSLTPSMQKDAAVPGYVLWLVGEAPVDLQAIASRCDQRLGQVNAEYAQKRESGRLAGIVAKQSSVEAFAERVGGERHRGTWEAQLKLLPLYPRLVDPEA